MHATSIRRTVFLAGVVASLSAPALAGPAGRGPITVLAPGVAEPAAEDDRRPTRAPHVTTLPAGVTGLALGPEGIVAAAGEAGIFKLDRFNDRLSAPILAGTEVVGLVASGTEVFALVPTRRCRTVLSHRVDLERGTLGGTIRGTVQQIFSADRVVTSSAGSFDFLDTSPTPGTTTLASVGVGGSPRASAVEGDRLFVACASPHSLAVISLGERRLLEEIPLTDEPESVVVVGGAAFVTTLEPAVSREPRRTTLVRIDLETRARTRIATTSGTAQLVPGSFEEVLFSDGESVLRLRDGGEIVTRTTIPEAFRGGRLAAAAHLDALLVRGNEVVFIPLAGFPPGC